MHPFWNQIVKVSLLILSTLILMFFFTSESLIYFSIFIIQLVPRSLAPNVLTFVGFLLTVSNALLLCYYDYGFYASSDSRPDILPIPSWVWIVCAVNHFLAHSLDGIDGKHARRTQSSGPTGELMDHGLDSWTALFVPFCIYSMFGRADHSYAPFRVLFIFWAVFVTFYLSHWEKYNTGILYLPWSYDSSQIALFVLYIVTYIYTPKAWKHKLPILNISTGQIFEIVTHGKSYIRNIAYVLYNIGNIV